MMFFTPADSMIFEQATPAAPTPQTTTVRSSKRLPASLRALVRAANITTAVPC